MAESFSLGLVEGELIVRDAEPYALTNPTSVSGSVDTETGAITGGSFATPQVNLEQQITSPLPADVFIDADFSMVTPASGQIDHQGAMSVAASVRVDLHIDVRPVGSDVSLVVADCTASPVNLTLRGVYDPGTQQVTLADEDFSVPAVVAGGACITEVAGAVNDQLAGAGHSLSMTLAGPVTLPLPPGCETATTLVASPAGQVAYGASVDLTATVSIPNPTQAECVEAATNGETIEGGRVDFFDDGDPLGSAVVQPDGTAVLSTTVIQAGDRDLTATFNQFTPFRASTSSVVPYRVTPHPAITSTLPQFHRIGAANATEFDVQVTNTGFGRDIDRGRLDVTLKRPEGSLDLKASRVVLEYLDDAENWVPVALTPQSTGTVNRVLWGSVADLTGFSLDIGESVTQRLRIRFPLTGGTVSTTSCTATLETCPGHLDAFFELIEVNETGAPAPAAAPVAMASASSSRRVTLVEATRRPSTITLGSTTLPAITPQTVRQGGTMSLNAVVLGPLLGGLRPLGHISVLLDGTPIGIRRALDGLPAENVDRIAVTTTANVSIMFDLPAGITAGTHAVTVRYGGDERFLPQQTTLTFTVVESIGSLFECRVTAFLPTRFRAFVEGQAIVPSTAPAGSEVALENFVLTMKFARENPGHINARETVAPNNTTRPVGGAGDLAIDLAFGPGGEGTGASLTRTFGIAMTTNGVFGSPGDPDPTQVDDRLVIDAPSGTVALDGEPGEVAPVTLDEIHLQDVNLSGFTTPMTCVPVGQPLLLGEVTLSGHTLTVDPGGSVREGEEVVLTSAVAPYGTGHVEFRSGAQTVGFSSVVGGVAVTDTTDLLAGIHTLTAIYTGGLLMPPLVSNAVGLQVVAIDCPPLEEGSGAVVRLVYMELLGRCPDPAGYAFWKARLNGGTSPQAFAAAISASDEAVGRVVNDAYQTMLGRDAEPAGKAFWVDRLQGDGRYDHLLADLAASPEFAALAGGTDEGFVQRVYERLLGRSADASGLAYWTGRLDVGMSPRLLVITFANLDEPLGRLVDAAYDDLLGRTPTAGERTDGIDHLRTTGDRPGLHAQLIGLSEFDDRAQEFPNT